ncbi:cytochrome-c peroxidase [Burkholderia pseudomultivorans]|uniref:cytochrome-c peroxidase n=2 Tax=Burkholderia pseudomultivorans TaxID=1207504 RepID=UPI000841F159|nr:cytochrome c peroxidase [Burkholderia pseudomultivorans]AOI88521.1 cytochrome-c peroxidase [Burkholderia pseudomultivorans]
MTARPAFPSPEASGRLAPRSPARLVRRAAFVVGAAVLGYGAFAIAFPAHTPAAIGDVVADWTGANAHPVVLQRPAAQPLSAVAQLGRALFDDPSLSASGRQSCASCHSPAHAYGPPNALDVQPGGLAMTQQGYRPPPSLMYLYRQPNFSIGPDAGENDAAPSIAQQAASAAGVVKAQKVAGTAAAPQLVPQGGMFWDGRADTLQQQAFGPLLNPVEMANTSIDEVARKLSQSAHRAQFIQLFGPRVFDSPQLAVSEAMFAIARYQVEDTSFHPYNSKYDRWLEGRARLTQAELRGLRLFNDPDKANCAGCHLSKPGKDGLPPMFTDYQYEALGAPRNRQLAQNRNPAFYDLGVCGPFRDDLKDQTQYCGMFLTPTLRNAATRHVFFHNGVFHTLDQVMAFYNERNTAPQKFYPRGPNSRIDVYDDIPAKYRANVDTTDAPFDRKPGDTPAMSAQDIKDIEAFLNTLTDEPVR